MRWRASASRTVKCSAFPNTAASSTSGWCSSASSAGPSGSHLTSSRAPLRRWLLELSGAADRDDPAAIDQRELITVFRLIHVVSRDEDGDAARGHDHESNPRTVRREIGSTPEVGSSRKRIAGRCSTAQPSARRCFHPPASVPVRSRSWPARPAICNRGADALIDDVARHAIKSAEEAQVLDHLKIVIERELLRHVTDMLPYRLGIRRDIVSGDAERSRRWAAAGRTEFE